MPKSQGSPGVPRSWVEEERGGEGGNHTSLFRPVLIKVNLIEKQGSKSKGFCVLVLYR